MRKMWPTSKRADVSTEELETVQSKRVVDLPNLIDVRPTEEMKSRTHMLRWVGHDDAKQKGKKRNQEPCGSSDCKQVSVVSCLRPPLGPVMMHPMQCSPDAEIIKLVFDSVEKIMAWSRDTTDTLFCGRVSQVGGLA